MRLLLSFCAWISFSLGTASMALSDNLVSSGAWTYFADTVMGGVSDGAARFDGTQGAIHLSGTVSTANNGGFIQVRTAIADNALQAASGISVTVKGNNETYYVHLRNRSARLPWQYYAADFTANSEWQTIKIPFTAFQRSSALMPKSFNPDTAKSLGLVAFGKDYTADLYVRAIEFY